MHPAETCGHLRALVGHLLLPSFLYSCPLFQMAWALLTLLSVSKLPRLSFLVGLSQQVVYRLRPVFTLPSLPLGSLSSFLTNFPLEGIPSAPSSSASASEK